MSQGHARVVEGKGLRKNNLLPMNSKEYPINLSAILRIATVFCLILLIGFVDYVTGFEISLSVFYLIPIFIATWHISRGFGFFVAVISSIAWFLSDHFAGHVYSNTMFAYWNVTVQLAFFVFSALLLSRLRGMDKKLNNKIIDYKRSEDAL